MQKFDNYFKLNILAFFTNESESNEEALQKAREFIKEKGFNIQAVVATDHAGNLYELEIQKQYGYETVAGNLVTEYNIDNEVINQVVVLESQDTVFRIKN
ncbi:hypothetical protein [Aneurinibacillus tyrosinisolvens]|uniref:hypothetical protein n=1 Tax=Aneurinibacillus tyrosinisolvens TaxID=1443435 RepID=UPI00063FB925|nr:hypothetical protein [Aneurinibacillus tyrosinisolvens]